MKDILLPLLVLLCLSPMAQVVHPPFGASCLQATAYAQQMTDVFAFTGNPAALAKLRQSAIGVSAERRFLLQELNVCHMALAVNTQVGNWGARLAYTGVTSLYEYEASLAYSRHLGKAVALGIQFNAFGLHIPGNGHISLLTPELGLLLRLTNRLQAGLHIRNPALVKMRKAAPYRMAAMYEAGIGYEVASKVLVCLQLSGQEQLPWSALAGVQYNPVDRLLLRLGMETGQQMGYIGAGFSFEGLRLDLMARYHPQLGVSPGFSLLAQLKNNSK